MIWLLSYWKPLLAGILLFLSAAGGWHEGSARTDAVWKEKWDRHLAADTEATAKAQQAANEQRQALAKAIQQDSATRYQEYTDAQHQNSQLRADLLTAQRRLSVKVSGCSAAAQVPGTASAGSVGDAEGRADLDPGDSAALLGIVNRGDDAIRQLTACQAYVKRILGE
ncbi:hypothetical protein A6723_024350 [Pseudomonas sp. AU11447]|uniref:lysis system i-spanin subunit Rz n=1 Tax=unclassified Pseudomonas TaxID=196821 RepID=UPI0006D3B48F|nr:MULTISPECIES: lysis system i-spanin subunit Rz [unclassified Pseudomonas]OBY91191.1 hypothetical protein A6723_024350 [Pseudomonas sp. AU11447]